jgi:glutathione S-transferase
LRYEIAARPETAKWSEFMERQRQRIVAACGELEKRWGSELRDVTVGSIAVAAALAYVNFRHGDLGWQAAHPKLAEWFAAASGKPSMRDG